MSDDKTDFRPAARKLYATLESGTGEHPSTEVLVAYHEGVLADDEADGLREHLAGCATCARRLLEYDRFGEEETEDETAADRAKGQDWAAIRKKLD